jgi:crotonobetainyl-CoA:carnitine CoA-transferase CaiB-like acyl-CoA transferase
LTHYMLSGEMPPKAGRGHTNLLLLWYTYRTGDGWMAVGGVDPTRWAAFCRAIGRPDLETDERWDSVGKRIRGRDELNAALDEHFSGGETEEWVQRLEAADVFCAPVLDYEQVTSAEQARVNGYVAGIEHPRLGAARVIPCPIAFGETPADSTRPEPGLGEHTKAVLAGFGYSAAEIEELRGQGVV